MMFRCASPSSCHPHETGLRMGVQLTLETPTSPGPVGWVFYGLYRGIAWLFVWN